MGLGFCEGVGFEGRDRREGGGGGGVREVWGGDGCLIGRLGVRGGDVRAWAVMGWLWRGEGAVQSLSAALRLCSFRV